MSRDAPGAGASLLVLNAGSSSLRFCVYALDDGDLVLAMKGQIEGLYTASVHFVAGDGRGVRLEERHWPAGAEVDHDGAIAALLDFLDTQPVARRVVAAGHRVVHGGLAFGHPARIDDDVLTALEALVPLAPLHQPHNLAAIRALRRREPALPQVACFDTAFHRGMPEVAQAFALPPAITDQGVRRYGFHGLSYEWIAQALHDHDPRAASGRVIVAHLGNGASMCAMRDGRSVATTMGFTALDGLPMGTRPGALDPGVVLHCLATLNMDAKALERLLYRQSGLLGVSGVSSDMRTLLASDAPRAAFAVDLFVYRVGREIGSLAAALGGLDALVFTGGIGEHAAPIRERVLREAAWLGVELDAVANAVHGPRLTTSASRVTAWAIPTDEERMIARHTLRTLGLAVQA